NRPNEAGEVVPGDHVAGAGDEHQLAVLQQSAGLLGRLRLDDAGARPLVPDVPVDEEGRALDPRQVVEDRTRFVPLDRVEHHPVAHPPVALDPGEDLLVGPVWVLRADGRLAPLARRADARAPREWPRTRVGATSRAWMSPARSAA